MDSFDFDNVKAEKAKAMRRFNRVQSIAQLFRLVELCLALIFLSWIFNRLPFAVKISGDFLRQLAATITSPLFVFLLSNGIIATLIAKSGGIGRNNNADTEVLYQEIVKNSGDRAAKSLSNDPPPPPPTEIVYQDKQIISEVNTNTITRTCEPEVDLNSDSGLDNPLVYRRSKSEKMEWRRREKVLRRSETDKCVKTTGEDFGENLYPEDAMSNEEFQQTIEAFIAKHSMFRGQQSLSIVLQNQS